MTPKRASELNDAFPELFWRDGRPTYFECGDGWCRLIYNLAQKLAKCCPEAEAVQVKEKFGGLRFYAHGCNDAAYEAIDVAESMSLLTCEECGGPGLRQGGIWVKTLCEGCRKDGPSEM